MGNVWTLARIPSRTEVERTEGEGWILRKIKELVSKRRDAPKGFVTMLKQYCLRNSFKALFLKEASRFSPLQVVFPHPGSNCAEALIVKQRAELWGLNWGSSSDHLCDPWQVATPSAPQSPQHHNGEGNRTVVEDRWKWNNVFKDPSTIPGTSKNQ